MPATPTRRVGAFASALALRLDLLPGDRYALVFPFPHVGGIGLAFAALQSGCTHLLDETVDPVATVRFLSERSCTHAGTGVPFYRMYLAAQERREEPLFPELKVCPGGGAPSPPSIHHRLVAELGGVGVASGWGLTEAPVLTNCDVRDPDDKLATTVGRAMPGVELITVAPDGSRCPRGVEGELRAKGPQVMLGYVDASLDADAFDEDDYYRTGDLGVIDSDGYVVITGRLKDVIIRNGENVSAKEVEDLLFTHPGRVRRRCDRCPRRAHGREGVRRGGAGRRGRAHPRCDRRPSEGGGAPKSGPARTARAARRPAPKPGGQGPQAPAPGPLSMSLAQRLRRGSEWSAVDCGRSETQVNEI